MSNDLKTKMRNDHKVREQEDQNDLKERNKIIQRDPSLDFLISRQDPTLVNGTLQLNPSQNQDCFCKGLSQEQKPELLGDL